MHLAEKAVPTFAPTPLTLLKQAEARQAQAAELAAIITQASNDVGKPPHTARASGDLAKGIIRARNRRSKFLPKSLFADPAWDILLQLYVAEAAQHRIAIGQVCAAIDIPSTTALRWINTLEANRLVLRYADPLDARRFFISLTESGRGAMEGFLQSIRDAVIAA